MEYEDPRSTNFVAKDVSRGGYFMAIDSAVFDHDFLRAFKRDCEEPGNKLLSTASVEKVFEKDGNRVGTYLSLGSTEYEFGE
jgi:hypothetical protein